MTFHSCELDRVEIAKLPHPGLVPSNWGPLTSRMQSWFPQNVQPLTGNWVVPYIYGVCAFSDIADALFTASTDDDRVYLIDWEMNPYVVLKPGTPPLQLSNYLSLFPASKAEIRAMLWDDTGKINLTGGPLLKVVDNVPAADYINKQTKGAAILDHKLPFARYGGTPTLIRGGTHHQKLLVVYGRLGLIAFTGGMDMAPTRVTVTPRGAQPWHDVHVRITGPAAAKLLRVFRERWRDHPLSAGLDQQRFGKSIAEVEANFAKIESTPPPTQPPPSITLPANVPRPTSCAVAIGRTYANLRKFNSTEPPYNFIPPGSGDRTAWALVEQAISNAKQYLYIEDQYFVSRKIRDLLVKKLRDQQFRFLLVLFQSSLAFEASTLERSELPYLIAARNEIRSDFAAIDSQRSRWRMFSLKASSNPDRQQWCGSYVHSKTILADDEFAIIGTANMDDRGYTLDTEVVAGITEDPLGRASGGRFARDLRVALWRKHLGVPYTNVADWEAGKRLWLRPPQTAMVADDSGLEDSPLLGARPILRNFSNEDRMWRETVDPNSDLLP